MQNQQEQQPTLIRTLKGHKQSVIALDLYPSCKYVASAGMDNTILLWNLTKKVAPLKMTGHKSQIHDLKFSPTGNLIVSASNDESLKFWDIDYETSGKETTLVKAHHARIRGLSFSCDGLLLASCGDDKLIKLWSTVDRRLQYSLKKHNNWVRNCQFSPTASNLASCDDKVALIWDIATKKQIQSYSEHTGVIHRVKFHSLGNCLATCSHDTKIKIYDLRSQSVIQVYEGHKGPVKSIDFHPNAPYLISSSDDGTTKIWNTRKSQLEYTIETHSNNTKFSTHGDYFITGGSDKIISIWKTGFWDSLNQKIIGGAQQSDVYARGKVTSELGRNIKFVSQSSEQANKRMFSKKIIQVQAQEQLKAAKSLKSLGQRQQIDTKVYYNHDQNFFQTDGASPRSPNQPIRSPTTILQSVLPTKLLNKLHRINHQLDFITKTTQILEARVTNNGEQLKKLVELTNDWKKETNNQ